MNGSGDRFALARSRLSSRHGAAAPSGPRGVHSKRFGGSTPETTSVAPVASSRSEVAGEVVRYLTLIRVPSSAPWQISRITPAAATSNTCMVSDCSLASTNALVSMMRTPVASASS